MSKTNEDDDQCVFCFTPLNRTLHISTECNHRFHFECIQKNIEIGNDKCPLCHRTLRSLASKFSKNNQAAASGNDDKDLKKSSGQASGSASAHQDSQEWGCETCTLLNEPTASICIACDQPRRSSSPSACANASSNLKTQPVQSKSQEAKDVRCEKPSDRLSKTEPWDEWSCSSCTYLNMDSEKICTICYEGTRPTVRRILRTDEHQIRHRSPSQESFASQSRRRSPSEETIRNPYPTKMTSHSTSRSSSAQVDASYSTTGDRNMLSSSPSAIPKSSVSTPTDHDTFIVYIPDLPADKSDTQLEQMIRERLENDSQITIIDIKCYPRFGVGVLCVHSHAGKRRLVSHVRSIVLDPPHPIMISFTDALELISYIVFDPKAKKMPPKDEVLQRWVQVYKTARPESCEKISALFPNIFRIVLTSFDDLLQASIIEDFAVNNEFATVYFRADCSYFEDLSATINRDDLFSTIAGRIGLRTSPASSLYVQCNKDAKTAIVLAAGQARKWIHESFLYFGTHVLTKKEHVAYRLLLHPVPQNCSLQSVLQHHLFQSGIVNHHRKEESLILELSDQTVYEQILTVGALRVDDHRIFIDAYSALNDPEGSEITAENWYETRMLDYKPDITPFVINHQDQIFRYKWNPKIWYDQFQKADASNQSSQDQNRIRHLLRVTTMLNTIGVIRKKRYMLDDNKEIKLRDEPLKTIVYNHQSKLFPARKISSSSYITKFPSTTVEVINRDCVAVYQQLASSGRHPLLLNMANQTSPGGGYRTGDGAQEENLFRRSNYCLSLDIEMDESKRSERFECAANGQSKPISKSDRMYPMDDFGAVYTSGITVFRHSEDRGYAFLDEPIYDVCAIAMAAFREPKLENQMLTGRAAAGMRKKIENIFAIAHHQNHDCLVLSAFGCGAFKNPPQHVAALFKSVIYQYAGYFRSVHFAIINDHNTGNQLNSQGNFLPFQKELDGLMVNPRNLKLVNVASGPFRLLNNVGSDGELDLSDAHIFDLLPCQYGAQCHDLYDAQHTKSFSHPSVCPYQPTCENTHDNVHMFSFIHLTKCRDGGECGKIKDEKHAHQYEHPNFCPDGGACNKNMHQEHLISYRHVPPCKYGQTCTDYQSKHREAYRHCRLKCLHGSFCTNFHNEQHIQEQDHPFPLPCPFTPFHCQLYIDFMQSNNLQAAPSDIPTHCRQYAHVCPFGRECNDTSELHAQISIHIPRQMCPYQDRCTKTNNEEHLNSFSHPKIRDIRELCSYSGYQCRDRYKIEHRHRYRHTKNHDYVGIGRYFALNKRTNFLQNQNEMSRILDTYIDAQKWHRPAKISSEITDWVRALEPIHRCRKFIFESILVHNHLMSRGQMNLLREARFVTNAVVQHGRFRHIFKRLNNPTLENHGRDLVHAIVSLQFDEKVPSTKFAMAPMAVAPITTSTSSDHQYIIQMNENILRHFLNPNEMNTIKSCARDIARASLNLYEDPMGIGYIPDKALGTDKHVFSIFGPHREEHYGEIVLVFKRELMFHPDANFSVRAATSFHSGNGYQWCPWHQDPGQIENRIKHFQQSKLHCSIPGYETAAALQLMALTGKDEKTIDVNLKEIMKCWSKVDSHTVFEGHLPQLIPLDYIDHVYIPQHVFDSLTPEAQQSARSIFRHVLTISDKTGKAYESFVYKEMINRIEQNISQPQISRGMIITLASSSFYEHIPLPMTISQSYQLFSHNKPGARSRHQPEVTLIYWQAMYGDMMVTMSNEPIDCRQEQPKLRCLICYIAEAPLMSSRDYHESHSYLTSDHPLKHSVILRESKFKNGSRRFYRGCNTDDYLTLCLKIEYLEGRVSLSHSGPNSIYNHEVIMAEFHKNEFDLSKLDFVHVSAGDRTIPVKNMVIRHEPIADLHPSFDTKFTKGGVAPSNSPGTSLDSKAPSTASEPKKEGIIAKIVNAVCTPFSSVPLTPCPHSVNCRDRELTEHNAKYSHPCRFSELCRNMKDEPHLTHTPHKVLKCEYDKSCRRLEEPVHRASYRHSDMADFFIPCYHHPNCKDKSSKHRQMYSHGERVPIPGDPPSG